MVRLKCLRVAESQVAAEWARQVDRQASLRVAGSKKGSAEWSRQGSRQKHLRVADFLDAAGLDRQAGPAGEPTGCRAPKNCRVESAGGAGRPSPCLPSCLLAPFRLISDLFLSKNILEPKCEI